MRICLDPGHGGKDPGAVSPDGLKEANVTALAVAFLFTRLRRLGHDVLVTRMAASMPLSDRCAVANKWRADLFVSIHCNGHINPQANGSETYYYRGSARGKALAETLQRALVTESGLADRRVKPATFYVLRHTEMPAALVELAFITNPNEEKLLEHPGWLERVANALGDALHIFHRKEVQHW